MREQDPTTYKPNVNLTILLRTSNSVGSRK